MERTSSAEAGEEGLVEDLSSTGCSETHLLVSGPDLWARVAQGPSCPDPPLNPPPPARAWALPQGTAWGQVKPPLLSGPTNPSPASNLFSPEPGSGSPPALLLVPVLVPIAAVTNCHKHSGLRQHSVFSCSSGGQKSKMHPKGLKIKAATGLPSFQRLQGKLLLCLYHLLGAAYLPTQCWLPFDERQGAGH